MCFRGWSEGEYDEVEAKYRKLGIWRNNKDFREMYLSKYNIKCEFCYWDTTLEAIKVQIEII